MTGSEFRKTFAAAMSAAAVLALAVLMGGVQQPVAAGAGDLKIDQASTSTTPPPTTLATASATPADKAPPYGKK